MYESLKIYVVPRDAKNKKWLSLLTQFRDMGFAIDTEAWRRLHDAVDLYAPQDDARVTAILGNAKEQGVVAEWRRTRIQQHYTEEDVRMSPLFSFTHVGRDVEIGHCSDGRASVSKFVEYDASNACSTCGSGTRQVGRIHLLASELNKCTTFASIFVGTNEFALVPDVTLEALQAACGDSIPVRPVEPRGKTKLRQKWWQLDPSVQVPIEAMHHARYVRRVCTQCGAPRLDHPDGDAVMRGVVAVRASAITTNWPAAMLSPYWSGDAIEWTNEGAIAYVPSRPVWFRGDVGRALRRLKIRGLELEPILPEQALPAYLRGRDQL